MEVYKHEGILAFGCNCGGKSRIATSTGQVQRVTIYQVLSNTNTVVGEFGALADARVKATEEGGRVRVSSKIITNES